MRPVLSCASLCLALALAAPAAAQSANGASRDSIVTTAAPATDTAAAPAAQASTRDDRVAAHYPDAPKTLMVARASSGTRQSKAMMVVGLGAFVAGAIIGGTPGTIIMVGGAVIGLMGLYEYLQ